MTSDVILVNKHGVDERRSGIRISDVEVFGSRENGTQAMDFTERDGREQPLLVVHCWGDDLAATTIFLHDSLSAREEYLFYYFDSENSWSSEIQLKADSAVNHRSYDHLPS